jgi:hypothetical protein
VANLEVNGSTLGASLKSLLMCDEIQPGAPASYQLCKVIYTFHPLGAKIAEEPIRVAQSQPREISIPAMPGIEQQLLAQWDKQWISDGADKHIFNTAILSRVYGIASLCVVSDDIKPHEALPLDKLSKIEISFNELDPLNTAGSLVLNQRPNATDFQKVDGISVNGVPYHRTRAVVMMNESPIYIEYTPSGFGYVGRSAYQRALLPLKSFIQSMITDDMVIRKAGIIILILKGAGSIIDKAMMMFGALKRAIMKQAQTDNVISIDKDEDAKAIDLTNVDGAHESARAHVLQNIAASVPMPARMLNHETFAEGFGEGTEDAKAEARYIDRIRTDLQPLYAFMDPIIQRRAFNEDFYKTIQHDFPEEYGAMPYQTWLYKILNSFKAKWPNLLTEPDSEKIGVEDVRFRAVLAGAEMLLPIADPENKAKIVAWLQDVFNNQKLLFGTRLELDFDALANYVPPQQEIEMEGAKQKNLEGSYKPRGDALVRYNAAMGKLPTPVIAPNRTAA